MKNSTTFIITILILATIGIGVLFISPSVSAQARTGSGGQALEIGPTVLTLSANPGQTITAEIKLRDITPGSLLVTNQINDFVANGEDGTPKIILDTNESSPYSLKSWINPLPELTLKSKELKTLTITIEVPAYASPGGYYGVVRFTGTPAGLETSGVSLSASLGALILLTVNGNAKEELNVEQFFANNHGKPGTLFESAPITFISRIKNSGNIHEKPAGIVTVTDMFGKKVVTLGVNQPPHDILPSSIRKFESPIDSTNIGNKILFGRYHAKLELTYGTNKQTITSETSFWVIPYKAITVAIIGLILLFLGLRFFIRRYNRHIISKAKNSHK